MYNFRPKLAEVDPDNPNMWARCDRCGFITNIDKMVWQWDFRGTPNPINTRILTCGRNTCLDVPQPQNAPIILSPDPEPVFNARPYPYTLEESSWLMTQDGVIITTEDGEDFSTAIPNPEDRPEDGQTETSSVVEEAAVNITTEDGVTIVTEAGDGNPLDLEPNPGYGPNFGPAR